MVRPCIVCREKFCTGHRADCPRCREPHCRKHGERAHNRRQVYCLNCLAECATCGASVRHVLDDLKPCQDCTRRVCPEHVAFCVNCGHPLCRDHVLQTPLGAGCRRCFAPCSTDACGKLTLRTGLAHCHVCGPHMAPHCPEHTCVACEQRVCPIHFATEVIKFTLKRRDGTTTRTGRGCVRCFAPCASCRRIRHRSRLQTCHLCPAGDGALHCAADHAHECALCRKPACEKHRVVLHDGREACLGCAAVCSHCSRYFPRTDVRTCHTHGCGKLLCPDHAVASRFRPEHYCAEHSRDFVDCPGCDRRGPAPQLQGCDGCEVSYCPHCQGVAGEKYCAYCRKLAAIPEGIPYDLDRWNQAVQADTALPERVRREIGKALSPGRGGYVVARSEGRSHVILRGEYHGGFFAFLTRLFHQVQRFIVVGSKADGTVRVKVNP
jgi:hypothetical protein